MNKLCLTKSKSKSSISMFIYSLNKVVVFFKALKSTVFATGMLQLDGTM